MKEDGKETPTALPPPYQFCAQLRFILAPILLVLACKLFKSLHILLQLTKHEKGSVVHPIGALDLASLNPASFPPRLLTHHDEDFWVSIHVIDGKGLDIRRRLRDIRRRRRRDIDWGHQRLRNPVFKPETRSDSQSVSTR